MSGKNPLGSGKEPQSYEGTNAIFPISGFNVIKSKVDPGNNKKFPVPSLWLNTVLENFWIQVAPGVWEEISTSSGNVLSVTGTSNQITASPTTGAVVLSLPSAITTPGSLTTTTTLTATLGDITATNGNLNLNAAGNKLNIHATTAASDSVGTTAVMSGTPGAVTVTTSACTASSIILFSRKTTGGTPGQVSITAQSGGSFTLTSTGNETSTFNYLIIN